MKRPRLPIARTAAAILPACARGRMRERLPGGLAPPSPPRPRLPAALPVLPAAAVFRSPPSPPLTATSRTFLIHFEREERAGKRENEGRGLRNGLSPSGGRVGGPEGGAGAGPFLSGGAAGGGGGGVRGGCWVLAEVSGRLGGGAAEVVWGMCPCPGVPGGVREV